MAFKRSGVRSPSAPLYFISTYGIRPVGAFFIGYDIYHCFITFLLVPFYMRALECAKRSFVKRLISSYQGEIGEKCENGFRPTVIG